MCAVTGAGPAPIPQKKLTTETLSQAIRYCLSAEAARAAQEIAQKMQTEDGVKAAAQSFHQNLPVKQMACDLLPHLPAAFCYNKGRDPILLSSLAAQSILQKTPKEAKYLEL